MRLVLINFKIINIWDDEGSRRDIVGCMRLSFKLRLILSCVISVSSCVRLVLLNYKIVFVNSL